MYFFFLAVKEIGAAAVTKLPTRHLRLLTSDLAVITWIPSMAGSGFALLT